MGIRLLPLFSALAMLCKRHILSAVVTIGTYLDVCTVIQSGAT